MYIHVHTCIFEPEYSVQVHVNVMIEFIIICVDLLFVLLLQYIFLFQTPRIPELMLSLNDLKVFETMYTDKKFVSSCGTIIILCVYYFYS